MFFQAAPVSNSSYQPATKPVETSRPPASNGDVTDFTKLSAKEMRELVASKKKRDPRKENTDFRRKYDEFNRLWDSVLCLIIKYIRNMWKQCKEMEIQSHIYV